MIFFYSTNECPNLFMALTLNTNILTNKYICQEIFEYFPISKYSLHMVLNPGQDLSSCIIVEDGWVWPLLVLLALGLLSLKVQPWVVLCPVSSHPWQNSSLKPGQTSTPPISESGILMCSQTWHYKVMPNLVRNLITVCAQFPISCNLLFHPLDRTSTSDWYS